MRGKAALWCVWTFHLSFCALFICWPAFHDASNPVWPALRIYGSYTGAANAYGFFSPAVPSARRFRIQALCGDRSIPVNLPYHGETYNRLTTIASLTSYKQIEEAVAGSLGAYALGRNECASAALVSVDYFAVPSIADFRRGDRSEWRLLHVYPLTRASMLKAAPGGAE